MSNMYEEWVDRWKGILIFLVVLGHVVGGAYHMTNETVQPSLRLIYKIIYLFHMPAFFFVAGFTFKTSQGGGQYMTNKVRRLVVPYLVFGAISVAIYCAVYGVAGAAFSMNATTSRYDDRVVPIMNWIQPIFSLLHGGGWPNGEGFRSNSVLWFLPVMFSTMMIFKLSYRFGYVGLTVVACLGAALDISHIVPMFLPWGLSKVPGYLPYVVMGKLVSSINRLHQDIHCKGMAICCSFVFLFIYSVAAYFVPDPMIMKSSWYGHLLFHIFGILGCVMSVLIAKSLVSRFWVVLGGASLGIMLLHKFFVMGAELKVPVVRMMFQQSSTLAVVASFCLSIVVSVTCLLMIIPIRKFAPWALGGR